MFASSVKSLATAQAGGDVPLYPDARPRQFDVDANLCKYCQILTNDILAEPEPSNHGWELLQSRYFTLVHLKEHHDGVVRSLLQSADAHDCGLCVLLAEGLNDSAKPIDSNQRYHIFVRKESIQSCQFLLGTGEMSNFLEDIFLWEMRPVHFIFFRRNGHDTRWFEMDRQRIAQEWQLPPLFVAPNHSPRSEEAIHRAQSWLSECVENHSKCRRREVALPHRVLDLGVSYESYVSLFLPGGLIASYATLSYSWGSALPLKTTNSNIDQHCAGMRIEAFPKTLKDAIFISRRLGFRYLWVDALCIIQGDAADWAKQGAAMTDIYQGSTLNISAMSSLDCNSEMLGSLAETGFRVGTYFHPDGSGGKGDIFVGREPNVLDLGDKHLSTRGWAFQERLVSVASLHYTDEGMVWECASETKLEHDQRCRPDEWKINWVSMANDELVRRITPAPITPKLRRPPKDEYDFWSQWVSEFSKRQLSFIDNKLPAMAGVASSYADKFRYTYLAGLWKENLPSGLLWQRDRTVPSLTRFTEYAAPSWSWASVSGLLKYRNVRLHPPDPELDFQLQGVEVQEEHPMTFGKVLPGAQVHAKGWLQKVAIDTAAPPLVKTRYFPGSDVVEGVVPNAHVVCMLDVNEKPTSQIYNCWCLRVGSYNDGDGRSICFLLLKEEGGPKGKRFSRIGVAETDVRRSTGTYEPVPRDVFVAGQRSELTLI